MIRGPRNRGKFRWYTYLQTCEHIYIQNLKGGPPAGLGHKQLRRGWSRSLRTSLKELTINSYKKPGRYNSWSCCWTCFEGTAGDNLGYHRGNPFTTKDRDNDNYGSTNCAVQYKGAWWYNSCYGANLNGLYLHGKISDQGMSWNKWKNSHYSVKRSEMKIRPKDF